MMPSPSLLAQEEEGKPVVRDYQAELDSMSIQLARGEITPAESMTGLGRLFAECNLERRVLYTIVERFTGLSKDQVAKAIYEAYDEQEQS